VVEEREEYFPPLLAYWSGVWRIEVLPQRYWMDKKNLKNILLKKEIVSWILLHITRN
jgi:hypothetical protein